MYFNLEERQEGNATVIKLSGELCNDTVGRAQALVADVANKTSRGIVFDLTCLDFVDSKGAGFLLQMKKIYNGNRAIVLAGLQGSIKSVLTRLMITEQIKTYNTVEDAVKRM